MSSRRRNQLAEEMETTIRQFMTHAVIYQDAVAKWAGLSSTVLQCAGLLMLDGPMTPSELAARTGLSGGGAITAVIDHLERAGLAHRSRDDIDRRRVLVSPNPAAMLELVGAVYARIGQRWNDYLTTLTDDQITQTIQILQHATTINRDEVELLRTTPRAGGTARTQPRR